MNLNLRIFSGLALCLMLLAGTATGQNGVPNSERGPILWWPMTNLLSPSELKAIWNDDSLHRVRYLQAVQEGLREPLPEEELDRLISFWDGASTPELLPLWLVFNAYSTNYHSPDQTELDRLLDELRAHGFDESATQHVMEAAQKQADEKIRIVAEVRTGSREFVDVQRQAVQVMGPAGLEDAIERRDTVALALATSKSPQDVANWMRDWRRSPAKEAVVDVIRDLKSNLSPSEWNLFRSFLFHHAAPNISTIDFSRPEVAQ